MIDDIDAEQYKIHYKRAVGLLARREHSCQELRQKLAQKDEADENIIERVLEALIEQGYQSDQRFAEMVLRTRYGNGFGPIRVRHELKQKGVAGNIIQALLFGFTGDWFAAAKEARAKRFGALPADFKARAKQMRFLAGRGFDQEQIRYVVGEED